MFPPSWGVGPLNFAYFGLEMRAVPARNHRERGNGIEHVVEI